MLHGWVGKDNCWILINCVAKRFCLSMVSEGRLVRAKSFGVSVPNGGGRRRVLLLCQSLKREMAWEEEPVVLNALNVLPGTIALYPFIHLSIHPWNWFIPIENTLHSWALFVFSLPHCLLYILINKHDGVKKTFEAKLISLEGFFSDLLTIQRSLWTEKVTRIVIASGQNFWLIE